MTEQRALEVINEEKDFLEEFTSAIFDEAFEVAIKALEEINLYKQCGLCLIPADIYKKQCEKLDELEEKQIAKKVLIKHHEKTPWTREISQYLCPCCDRVIGFNGQIHCSTCGQKLLYDWGNEDDRD